MNAKLDTTLQSQLDEIQNKLNKNEDITIRELRLANDHDLNRTVSLEYCEDCDDEEVLTVIDCVNTENDQRVHRAYVPADMADILEAERETAETGDYHNWTASYPPTIKFDISVDSDDDEEKVFAILRKVQEYEKEAMANYPAILGCELDTDSIEWEEVDYSMGRYSATVTGSWNIRSF